jgi:predicted Zn finger-like uncharacterized protein
MILTCPACSARFVVDPAVLGYRGRMVRCARCRETWHAAPSEDDFALIVPRSESFPEEDPIPEPQPQPPPSWNSYAAESVPGFLTDAVRTPPASGGRKALPAVQQPHKATAKAVAWLVIAALVVALLVLLTVGRARIVALWPATAPIYGAFGLHTPVAGTGLELREVNSAVSQVDNKPTLIVAGRIANVTDTPQKVPPLVITLRDTKSVPVKSWTIQPSQPTLLGGESMSFQTSQPSPPDNAVSAMVTFGPLPATAK